MLNEWDDDIDVEDEGQKPNTPPETAAPPATTNHKAPETADLYVRRIFNPPRKDMVRELLRVESLVKQKFPGAYSEQEIKLVLVKIFRSELNLQGLTSRISKLYPALVLGLIKKTKGAVDLRALAEEAQKRWGFRATNVTERIESALVELQQRKDWKKLIGEGKTLTVKVKKHPPKTLAEQRELLFGPLKEILSELFPEGVPKILNGFNKAIAKKLEEKSGSKVPFQQVAYIVRDYLEEERKEKEKNS